ncbi:MAG: hypothetical protein WCJ51_03795, partial [Candidatus Moraniibacteriota bacterium]
MKKTEKIKHWWQIGSNVVVKEEPKRKKIFDRQGHFIATVPYLPSQSSRLRDDEGEFLHKIATSQQYYD